MAILETFYLLFKADTTDLKKGSKEAQREVDKTEQAITNSAKAAQQLRGNLVGIGATLTGLAAGIISVGLITRSLSAAVNYTQELGAASRALNVNVSDLDAWGRAVQRTGGTASGFQQSLQNLAKNLGTDAQGAMSLLPKLANSFSKLNNFQAKRYGNILGLDLATIQLLQQGNRELSRNIARQKELGVVTQHDADISREYNNAVVDSQHAWNSLFITLGMDLLPTLTKVVSAFTDTALFFREHKGLLVGGMIAIGAAAAIMVAPIIAAQFPIILVTTLLSGLIAAFALAYEDIQYFLAGNESLTGDILKKWPIVGDVIKSVIGTLKAEFKLFLDIIETVVGAFGKIAGFFGGGANLSATINQGQSMLGMAGANGLNSRTSSSILGGNSLNRTSSVNTGDITINTQATDAQGIGDAFKNQLQSHFWHANSFADDGIAY